MERGHQHDVRPQRCRSRRDHGAVPEGPEPVSEELETRLHLSLLIKDLSLSQPASSAHNTSAVLMKLSAHESLACFMCVFSCGVECRLAIEQRNSTGCGVIKCHERRISVCWTSHQFVSAVWLRLSCSDDFVFVFFMSDVDPREPDGGVILCETN